MSEQEYIPRRKKVYRKTVIVWFLGVGGVILFLRWLTASSGGISANALPNRITATWPGLLAIASCLILLTLLTFIEKRWPVGDSPSSAPTRWDRETMLWRLRRSYDEAMSHSLQGAVWLELGLASRPGAVQNATTLLLRLTDRAGRQFPAGTTLLQIYDKAAHELLILGEPGAGKSTLLTSLAKELVTRAQADDTHPLPVIFPLSSWATKRPPLGDWLAEQLSLLYDVPHWLSEHWVREEQILPLFDGLDEVQEDARPACIEAINAYHRERLGALVVCSRTSEYTAATTQHLLALQGAVVVQPLTREQVDAVLAQMGKDVAALRGALKKNPALQELTTTPLMLNVLILTYRGTSVRELPGKHAALQQQVWTDYVARMVERKGETVKSKADAQPLPRYPLEQTCAWLGWLAYQMRKHDQTVFYLEQLQPDWLAEQRQSFYQWFIALSIGLGGLTLGLIFGLRSGGLIGGLIGGLLIGLACGLIGRLYCTVVLEIKPVETPGWSWKSFAVQGLFGGLRGGLFVGLIFGLVIGLRFGQSFGLLFGLFFGLFSDLMIGLTSGFSDSHLTKHLTLFANEGIRIALRNGLLGGLFGCLFGGLLGGLASALNNGLEERQIFDPLGGLLCALGAGLLIGLITGLGAVVYHYTLRLWLACARVFPWQAVPFLEDATKRILLRRVGGGYRFAHALLQDYFEGLYVQAASASSSSQQDVGNAPAEVTSQQG